MDNELERLRAIVAKFAATPPVYDDDSGNEYCHYCSFTQYPNADYDADFAGLFVRGGHEATCAYILACAEVGTTVEASDYSDG